MPLNAGFMGWHHPGALSQNTNREHLHLRVPDDQPLSFSLALINKIFPNSYVRIIDGRGFAVSRFI